MTDRYLRELERRTQSGLARLTNAGLVVDDASNSPNSTAKALHYIVRIGIDRFETYFRSLQRHTNNGPDSEIPLNDVLKIYKFDRRLRLLTLDALERVEVTTKALICGEMSEKFGRNWLKEKRCGVPWDLRKEIGSNMIRVLRIRTSKTFSFNEVARLGDQGLISDAMSFGQMSKVFRHLQANSQQLVSGVFRSNPKAFSSWLRTITHVRNDCAHHMVLWDKRYVTRPRITGNISRQFGGLTPPMDFHAHYFGHATLIYYLVQGVARNTHWHQRLYGLLNSRDVIPDHIDVCSVMKFPPEWYQMPFWRDASGSAT